MPGSQTIKRRANAYSGCSGAGGGLVDLSEGIMVGLVVQIEFHALLYRNKEKFA